MTASEFSNIARGIPAQPGIYKYYNEAGDLITSSLETLFEKGIATDDLARFMKNGQAKSTSEFAGEVVAQIVK